MSKTHPLDNIRSDALTFGKINPLGSMIGSRGRCRERHRWENVPRCLADVDKVIRRPREDHGKHLAKDWRPCISAPVVESFYQRNMRLGRVGKR
jgi:hypothetical protein